MWALLLLAVKPETRGAHLELGSPQRRWATGRPRGSAGRRQTCCFRGRARNVQKGSSGSRHPHPTPAVAGRKSLSPALWAASLTPYKMLTGCSGCSVRCKLCSRADPSCLYATLLGECKQIEGRRGNGRRVPSASSLSP